MKRILTALLAVLCLCSAQAEEVKVVFYTPDIVRIVKGGDAPGFSFAVTAQPGDVSVRTSGSSSAKVYRSSALTVTSEISS